MHFLEDQSLDIAELLDIPRASSVNAVAYRKRMVQLATQLAREIELPEERRARVADLLAIMAYRRLRQ
jgi:hypothetical protein